MTACCLLLTLFAIWYFADLCRSPPQRAAGPQSIHMRRDLKASNPRVRRCTTETSLLTANHSMNRVPSGSLQVGKPHFHTPADSLAKSKPVAGLARVGGTRGLGSCAACWSLQGPGPPSPACRTRSSGSQAAMPRCPAPGAAFRGPVEADADAAGAPAPRPPLATYRPYQGGTRRWRALGKPPGHTCSRPRQHRLCSQYRTGPCDAR